MFVSGDIVKAVYRRWLTHKQRKIGHYPLGFRGSLDG